MGSFKFIYIYITFKLKFNSQKKKLKIRIYELKKIHDYERLLNLLQELIVDIIPIEKEHESQIRHADHLRPTNIEEEKFMSKIDSELFDLLKSI